MGNEQDYLKRVVLTHKICQHICQKMILKNN